jgi:sporulation protein YlmC with PRC-barrel domain
MIGLDRIELNNRFCIVFHELEKRSVIRKNDRAGKGIGDVADIILGVRTHGHIIRAFLNPNNKRVIDYEQARKFCRAYSKDGVNMDYVIDGVGEPFGSGIREHRKSGALDTYPMLNSISGGNIIFTSIEAFAGASLDLSSFTREEQRSFSMPGLAGDGLVAFPVKGNSMEPVILNGDIVICRQVNHIREIKENQIYAVRNNGQVWVKYVQMIQSKTGTMKQLKLLSANYIEHDPFFEDINDSTRIYKVVRRISEM